MTSCGGSPVNTGGLRRSMCRGDFSFWIFTLYFISFTFLNHHKVIAYSTDQNIFPPTIPVRSSGCPTSYSTTSKLSMFLSTLKVFPNMSMISMMPMISKAGTAIARLILSIGNCVIIIYVMQERWLKNPF